MMTSDFATNMPTSTEPGLGSIALPPTARRPLNSTRPMHWEQLDGSAAAAPSHRSRAGADEMVRLCIELGRAQIDVEEVPKLRSGAVVPLDHAADDPVEVYACGRLVARGEVVVVDGMIGVRVTEVLLGGTEN